MVDTLVPHDFHHLVAELAETCGPRQIELWLMGTVARRNSLPPGVGQRLAGLVDAHRRSFVRTAA